MTYSSSLKNTVDWLIHFYTKWLLQKGSHDGQDLKKSKCKRRIIVDGNITIMALFCHGLLNMCTEVLESDILGYKCTRLWCHYKRSSRPFQVLFSQFQNIKKSNTLQFAHPSTSCTMYSAWGSRSILYSSQSTQLYF